MSVRPLSFDLASEILNREPVFTKMKQITENSPYHREASVFVHTQMVCAEYERRADPQQDWFWLGYFACLFHDVAKPICRIKKENAERGVYYSYDKHDGVGASMTADILSVYPIHTFDIYRICWMIEYHQLFWSCKQHEQRHHMARILRTRDFYAPFKQFMISDDFGRIADHRTIDSQTYFADFEREFHPFKLAMS